MLDIQNSLTAFEKLKVLIVGDVMLDHYIEGQVNRISPEAPVPIVEISNQNYCAGGAANVALNIQALGATPYLCSIIGNDQTGQQLVECLSNNAVSTEYLISSKTRKTTCKKRVLSQGQQLIRLDEEDRHALSSKELTSLLNTIKHIVEYHPIDIIILQDYDKGILFLDSINAIMDVAKQNKIPVAVDPKQDNFFAYKGATLFKPNLREISEQVPFKIAPTLESLELATAYINEQLQNKETLITLSDKGLFYKNQSASFIVPTTPRSIADVCGAGDTVISMATLGLAADVDRKQLAILCNLAGGQVCETLGVAPINKARLLKDIKQYNSNILTNNLRSK